jgi:hypothetical protein
MNYLKVYCNLIRKAEDRTPPDGYTEKHHIFPKSIFGKNNRIVILTGREHYIAHALLEKICIKRYSLDNWKTIKMITAFWCMNNQNTKNEYFNSYLYENLKIRYTKNVKGENHHSYGRNHTQETKNKISKKNSGRKPTEETRKKLSEIRKGRPGICGFRGKTHTEESKQKMREQKEVKHFCVISPTGEIICDKNANEFCRKNGLIKGCFSKLLNGKTKSHKGFRLYLGEDT